MSSHTLDALVRRIATVVATGGITMRCAHHRGVMNGPPGGWAGGQGVAALVCGLKFATKWTPWKTKPGLD